MRRTIILGAVLGAAMLAGCVRGLELPPNFVAMEKADLGHYDFRAVSADGVVLALSVRDNPKKGTLEFWSEAIRNELTDRGYSLVKTEAVESSSNVPGTMLTMEEDLRGQKFTYVLAVFVKSREVLIAEAGGKADLVRLRMTEITKSLLSAK